MSRPTKATVDYFPHYVNHGKTMFTLENKYGNDGYAFWFKLLELLGGSEQHFINCNDIEMWEFLIAKTRLNEETAIEILNLLSRLGAIDQKLWGNKIIRSDNYIQNIEAVYKRREVNVINNDAVMDLCLQKPPLMQPNDNNNPQSKVKESKVKKSINISVPDGTVNHQFLFDYYLSLELVKHKELTPEMKNAIDTARRRGKYRQEDMERLLRRHSLLVKLTADNGEYAIKKRTITEFFGQRVHGGTALVCSEYADDGAKWLFYKQQLEKTVKDIPGEEIDE